MTDTTNPTNPNEVVRLTKKQKNKIDDICELGDLLIIDSFDYQGAIVKFKEALELVPEPKDVYDTTTWLYTAIGDAYYLDDKFDEAMEWLQLAYKLPMGESAFILFRIGQCYHQNNDIEKAKELLLRAYNLAGDEVFGEDIKDLDLIRDLIK